MNLTSVDNFKHINYLDCPHFAVGHVDQWSENGYLLFEGMIYWYEVDRKDQCDNIRSPLTIRDFLSFAEKNQIAIPDNFMEKLAESAK